MLKPGQHARLRLLGLPREPRLPFPTPELLAAQRKQWNRGPRVAVAGFALAAVALALLVWRGAEERQQYLDSGEAARAALRYGCPAEWSPQVISCALCPTGVCCDVRCGAATERLRCQPGQKCLLAPVEVEVSR